MKRRIMTFLILLFGINSLLMGQTKRDSALLWLQTHQEELSYTIKSEEKEHKISFQFLQYKIVEHTENMNIYTGELSIEEQEYFYYEFKKMNNLDELEMDTIPIYGGKLGMVRIVLENNPIYDIMDENKIYYDVFSLGYALEDEMAKQRVFEAISHLMDVVPEND